MEKKNITFLAIFVSVLLSMAMISALSFNPSSLSTTKQQGTTASLTFTITNNESTDLTGIDFTKNNLVSGLNTISSNNLILQNLPTELVDNNASTVTLQITIPSSQPAGTYTGSLGFSSNEGEDTNLQISLTVTDSTDTLCEKEGYSDKGDLEISDFNIDVEGSGSDDEWEYLDKITIEVEIENTNNDDDVEDVEVMIAIYDNPIELGGNDVTNDFDFDDEVLSDIGRLRDDDQETVTFVIDELPSDLDDGTYYLYLMAYEDGNEDNQCMSESTELDSGDKYFEFSVESVDYEDSIVAKGTELESSINVICGQENLEITVPVYNLGEDEEEKVLVNLYSSILGIDEYQVIDDLDNGDKEVVSFLVDIPENLNQERYNLDIIVSFDWDDDLPEDEDTSYDEQTSDKSIRLNVLGCEEKAPTITATLESTMEVGQNLVVKAIITNNGDLSNFVVTPTGYESWADLVGVDPQTLTIASGNTQEVTITLSPKESGQKTFTISTISEGKTYNQPVSVRVADEPGAFSGFEMDNLTLYLIAGIGILIILIILVLIVKAAKKPSQ